VHIYFSGQKVWHIDNKNNMLCMNAFTYVMTLIMDKTWKKPLEHFCGLGMWFFVTFLNIKNNNFHANEQHSKLHNLTHLSLGTNAKFYYLSNYSKIKHLNCMGKRLQRTRLLVFLISKDGCIAYMNYILVSKITIILLLNYLIYNSYPTPNVWNLIFYSYIW
jgi:hypothetical protein